ncbi:RNA-directed DNA polymerase from mobile element jockey [Plakobranchus ocellatus]|uniref:RNA-directed DNA polymerase from mobile element jockey n=1 Tax=Plakobranchus ocellatus TaxID=259542 RepID=A0AAV3YWJ6_9GAST|nr:RNA-directed DNA polymerase from mobile element jockey [Plakobranchus ocellatus]
MAAEVPLLPRPRGKKKPRRILRLPVPREQQKLKYQPNAGPKSPKDRMPLGKLNRFAPLVMDAEDTIILIWGDSFIPSSLRASAFPMECPPSPSKPQSPSKSRPPPRQNAGLGRARWHPGDYTLLLPQEAALLIRNGTRFSEIDLKTGLHAAAATISLEKTLTVCSLYLPPNSPVSKLSLAELFKQLPKPFLVLGDCNAHSTAWGDSRRDGRGRMLEENDLIILNSGEQTFVHSAYHSTSAIDFAVASSSIAAECSWAAHSDLCGSDHSPIFLTLSSHFNGNTNTTFNFKKADWNRFGDLCKLSLDDSVADIEQFTSKLLDAARSSIPFHKGTKNKTRVPWFTQECRQALRERKKAQRKYFKTPSFENFVNFKKQKAKAKFVIKYSKK